MEGSRFPVLDDLAEPEDADLSDLSGADRERSRQARKRSRLAEAVRRTLTRSGPLQPAIARKIAENLHGVIQDACARSRDGGRISRVDIIRAANLRVAGTKATFLYGYAVDPNERGLDPKRAKRLVRRPRNHLKLAEAAARLSGLDRDDVTLRLVEGTTSAEIGDEEPADPLPEHLEMLSSAITAKARQIAAECELDWYFRTIEAHGLAPTDEGWDAGWMAFQFLNDAMPKVDLRTRKLRLSSIRGVLTPGDASAAGCEMTVAPCIRTALVLAPYGPDRSVRAFFATRTVLLVQGHLERPKGDGSKPGRALWELVELPDKGARLKTSRGSVEVPDEDWEWFDREHGFPQMRGDEWEFEAVSAASIETVVDRHPVAAGSLLMTDDALAHPKPAFTKSPPGGFAANLERALLYGQCEGTGDTTLMALLKADARRRVAGLRAWVDREIAKIDAAVAGMSDAARSSRKDVAP